MSVIGNIIWLLFGGILIALEYAVSGLIFCITIIGIPWGIKCFQLAALALWPFGRSVVSRPQASGCLNTLMNVIWIFIGGIWICLSHLFFWYYSLYYHNRNPFRQTAFQIGRVGINAVRQRGSLNN